ncbi:DUF2746 domain-containing protein [Microbacterium sp. 2FI]|uniref:DUF2746 domain-containing protein n=1 Tax=Microbacterium sp. 2FI TaxID=2502193 RepID=UPI0010F4A056|nr:DUF2746 domain-containing protein [Microbacterium sp. 2FI]
MTPPPWLVAWAQSISLWDLALWTAIVVGLVVFIRKRGWRWIIAFARAILATAEVITSVQGLPDFIARTDQSVGAMRTQLENSHLTNLRDDVTEAIDTAKRVEEGVRGLHGRLDSVEQNVAQLAKADIEIRDQLEQTQPPKETP